MAGTLMVLGSKVLLRNAIKTPMQAAAMSSHVRKLIGKREIVGYGYNGEPSYVDRSDYPMPAIRWKEPSPDILALREKERGDWNNLSIEEKKALYRASFRQTFAEFEHSPGDMKSVIGQSLVFISIALWAYYFLKAFVYEPLPESFTKESREAQLRRIIDLQINPIQGISSKWDYEKDDWKK